MSMNAYDTRQAVHHAENQSPNHAAFTIAKELESAHGRSVPVECVREVLEAIFHTRSGDEEKEQLAELKEEIERWEKDSRRDEDKIEDLEREAGKNEDAIAEMESDLADANEQIEKLKTRGQDDMPQETAQQIADLNAIITASVKTIADLRREVAYATEMVRAVDGQDQRLAELNAVVDERDARLLELDTSERAACKRIVELTAMKSNNVQTIDELRTRLAAVESERDAHGALLRALGGALRAILQTVLPTDDALARNATYGKVKEINYRSAYPEEMIRVVTPPYVLERVRTVGTPDGEPYSSAFVSGVPEALAEIENLAPEQVAALSGTAFHPRAPKLTTDQRAAMVAFYTSGDVERMTPTIAKNLRAKGFLTPEGPIQVTDAGRTALADADARSRPRKSPAPKGTT